MGALYKHDFPLVNEGPSLNYPYLSANSKLSELASLMAIHGASYNEGRVFEDWLGTPALNTVAGILGAHAPKHSSPHPEKDRRCVHQ